MFTCFIICGRLALYCDDNYLAKILLLYANRDSFVLDTIASPGSPHFLVRSFDHYVYHHIFQLSLIKMCYWFPIFTSAFAFIYTNNHVATRMHTLPINPFFIPYIRLAFACFTNKTIQNNKFRYHIDIIDAESIRRHHHRI